MKKRLLLICSILFLLAYNSFSQSFVIRGKITGGNVPLPGVSIIIKGTKKGTLTDAKGEFSLTVLNNDILVISYSDYTSKEVPVNGKTFISETLEVNSKKLDEVIVVGYGVQKKATLTGAIGSISGEDLVKAPVSGVSNALAGMATGLQAIQSSGEFGGDKADIFIRGIATFNPSAQGPLILVDGVERNTYNNIDPNEIETINFLKDASATAVFGVRGANGVILITTKQGKAGKPKINATANVAMLTPTVLPKYLTSYDYAILRNEAIDNSNSTDKKFTEEDIELFRTGADPIFHPSHNWIDEMVAPLSFQQSYNVNISGGTEKLRYFTSFGYFTQNGAYNKPEQSFGFPYTHKYDRFNVRANFDFNFTEDFSMSVKLGQQITDNSIPNGGGWGAFDKAANTSPMAGSPFVDGKYIENTSGLAGGAPFMNVWGQAGPTSTGGAFITDRYDNTLNSNISLRYKLDKITRGLLIRAMGSYDSYYMKTASRNKYFPAYSILKDPNAPNGYIIYQSSDDGPYYNVGESIGDRKWRKVYAEAGAEYQRTFDNTHRVTGLVLANAQKLHDPTLQYDLPSAYLGIVGRVTYDYKSCYLVEVNAGYNGSENFPPGQRFGFFPAFSAGWIANEEEFFPKNDILSYLKLRGSYGKVGNDKGMYNARYLYLDEPYTLGNGGWQAVTFGNAGLDLQRYNVYREGAIGNHNVTWEVAWKMNIGADMRLFNDKLSISGDYFSEKRDKILANLGTVPEIVIASLKPANIGKVENHGYELEAGYKNKVNKFNYWSKATYSFARNKVVFKDETEKEYEWMRQTGRRIDQYFGLTFEGFYNTLDEVNDPKRPISSWSGNQLAPGDMKYRDLNNDGKIDTRDAGAIGYSNLPEIAYSFSFGGSWKGFDFSALLQGVSHVSVYYQTAVAYPFTNNGWGSAHAWSLERWTPERYANGEKITFPRVELNPGLQHNYQRSNFWIQKGDYLRLKNIEVGYKIAGNFLRKLGASYLRVYANGNNLITLSSIKYRVDPDARELWGRVLPSNKVFNCGVNIQF